MATKLNVTPLHDRVIVKPAKAEEKTAGGIIIPDTAKEKPQRGTVIAAGPGKKDEPVTVKEGDTVLYGKYAGTDISIDGEDLLCSSCRVAHRAHVDTTEPNGDYEYRGH